jgi:hypothetical protein
MTWTAQMIGSNRNKNLLECFPMMKLSQILMGIAIAAGITLAPTLANAQRVVNVVRRWHAVPGSWTEVAGYGSYWYINDRTMGIGGRQLAGQGLIMFSALTPTDEYITFNGFCSNGSIVREEAGVFLNPGQVRITTTFNDRYAPAQGIYRNLLITACQFSGTPLGVWVWW